MDTKQKLKEDARKLLAWEDIHNEETKLDEEQTKQLKENLMRAERDLKETVWRSHKNLCYLGKDNNLRVVDLGLITSSQANSMMKLIINRLRQDGEIEESINPNFLIRNWSPAFTRKSLWSIGQGEVPAQKWMQFHTKVLTRFASNRDLRLTMEVKFTVEGDVSEQQKNETKSALQELGVNDEWE